jgi:hypothetical protein
VVLEALRNGAGMRAVIHFKAILDPVAVKDLVQLLGIEMQAVLVATSIAMARYCRRLSIY